MTTLQVVVGAQFGSEAKGHVTQRLTERLQRQGSLPTVVRVAGPNAGHTGYDEHGGKWPLRQIPVAAVTKDPATLIIGPGSEIDLPVLLDEFDRLLEAGLFAGKNLIIHEEATMITNDHKDTEQHLVRQIGSTGKGIGAARAQRLYRVPGMRLADDPAALRELWSRGVMVANNHLDVYSASPNVIVEGTQGYGLGLRAGFYPKCTSSDCRAQDFLAMAGIAPWRYSSVAVWAVARIYPIRVAGDSGPLRNETSWEELGLKPEITTVTKKIRRVGQPDWDLVRQAVRANGGAPTVRLAVTMVDQMFPKTAGLTQREFDEDTRLRVDTYLGQVEYATRAQVQMVTTSPTTGYFRD